MTGDGCVLNVAAARPQRVGVRPRCAAHQEEVAEAAGEVPSSQAPDAPWNKGRKAADEAEGLSNHLSGQVEIDGPTAQALQTRLVHRPPPGTG